MPTTGVIQQTTLRLKDVEKNMLIQSIWNATLQETRSTIGKFLSPIVEGDGDKSFQIDEGQCEVYAVIAIDTERVSFCQERLISKLLLTDLHGHGRVG